MLTYVIPSNRDEWGVWSGLALSVCWGEHCRPTRLSRVVLGWPSANCQRSISLHWWMGSFQTFPKAFIPLFQRFIQRNGRENKGSSACPPASLKGSDNAKTGMEAKFKMLPSKGGKREMERGKEIKSERDVDKTQQKKDKWETQEMWWERKRKKRKEKKRDRGRKGNNPLSSEHVNIRPVGVWRGVWNGDKID